MTAVYTQTNCDSCTLAEAMKDCPHCRFDYRKTYQSATSADVFRMYRELWRDLTPDELKAVPMALDYTQSATVIDGEKRA